MLAADLGATSLAIPAFSIDEVAARVVWARQVLCRGGCVTLLPRRLGLSLSNETPVAETVALARRAEELGFSEVWLPESSHGRGVFTVAATCCRRHPADQDRHRHRQSVLAPSRRSSPWRRPRSTKPVGGRVLLGLGAALWTLRALGEADPRTERPLTAMVEAIRSCAACCAASLRASPARSSRFARGREARLPSVRPSIPVYVGGVNARMLRAAGAVADGVQLGAIVSPGYVRWAWQQIQLGAREAGRDPAELDLASNVLVSVDPDTRAARDAVRTVLAYYIHRVEPVVLSTSGADPDELQRVRQTVLEHGVPRRRTPRQRCPDRHVRRGGRRRPRRRQRLREYARRRPARRAGLARDRTRPRRGRCAARRRRCRAACLLTDTAGACGCTPCVPSPSWPSSAAAAEALGRGGHPGRRRGHRSRPVCHAGRARPTHPPRAAFWRGHQPAQSASGDDGGGVCVAGRAGARAHRGRLRRGWQPRLRSRWASRRARPFTALVECVDVVEALWRGEMRRPRRRADRARRARWPGPPPTCRSPSPVAARASSAWPRSAPTGSCSPGRGVETCPSRARAVRSLRAASIAWNPVAAWTEPLREEVRSHLAYMAVDMPGRRPARVLAWTMTATPALRSVVTTAGPGSSRTVDPPTRCSTTTPIVGGRSSRGRLADLRRAIHPELLVFDAHDYSVAFLDDFARPGHGRRSVAGHD